MFIIHELKGRGGVEKNELVVNLVFGYVKTIGR